MKEYFERNRIITGIALLMLVLCVLRIYTEKKPYPDGDAIEYTLMTEAFCNHFTPDVRPADCASFKALYTKKAKWEKNDKAADYDSVAAFIGQKDLKFLDYKNAFFVDREGRKYSLHFWFYSLLNLPVRWICAVRPFNPFVIFHITNFILVFCSCLVFLRTSRFRPLETGAFCLLFFYSTVYWYFCWPHPEVFTVCFVTMGLWMAVHEKWYTGILLVSIAALQNQPLAFLVAALCLIALFRKGITLFHILKTGASACLIFAPALFYYAHFGHMNMVAYLGALSTDYITPTREIGFFFDINQGMILALPLILLLYLFLYVRKLTRIKTAEIKWDMWLLPALIAVAISASTINNWNHGQATVNRYVTYVGAIVMIHFFILVLELKNVLLRQRILAAAIITQVATVLYHQKLNRFDWATSQPKPLSNWVLTHFPGLYNPDPVIFNSRYADGWGTDPETSPTYFMKKNGEITKFLVHRDYVGNLQQYGFTAAQVDSITPCLDFINDWAYITVSDDFKPDLSPEDLKSIDNEKRIGRQIKTIMASPEWYESVKKKATEQGISEADALRDNASYVLHIPVPARPKTEKQKIMEWIEKIRQDPVMIRETRQKAEQMKIPMDSALYLDAKEKAGREE